MATEELPLLLEDVLIATWSTVWLICDGGPTHFMWYAKQFHRVKWTSFVTFTIAWFHSCYLCQWDHLKGVVYSKRVNTWDRLWCLIEADVITIGHVPVPGLLCSRAQLCVSTDGEHFQEIWKHFANITMLLYWNPINPINECCTKIHYTFLVWLCNMFLSSLTKQLWSHVLGNFGLC